MLTKLIAEIENNTISYAKKGFEGDVSEFKSLWEKVFKQGNLKTQLIFLEQLWYGFNYTDELFDVIQKDLLNHPNAFSRLIIARFLSRVSHRIQPTAKYGVTIEKGFSDPDERVRLMILNAFAAYGSDNAQTSLSKSLTEKGVNIYKKILTLSTREMEKYDVITLLRIFGSNISMCADEMNQVLVNKNPTKWRNFLFRYLFYAGKSFHLFFHSVRHVFENPNDEKLLQTVLNTIHTVAWCKPVYDPKIQELIPDLEKLNTKNISLAFKVQIEDLIYQIKAGPVKDEIYIGF